MTLPEPLEELILRAEEQHWTPRGLVTVLTQNERLMSALMTEFSIQRLIERKRKELGSGENDQRGDS